MTAPDDRDWLGTPHLRFEREGPLAWCTIDRPRARNALTAAMYFGIRRAIEKVASSRSLHALILTGVGDVFAPGGDMAGGREDGEDDVAALGTDALPFRAVMQSPIPVVSAVNGICQGGGLMIAMLSDVCLAGDRAVFRAPEALRGVPDAWYASVLPAHVGVARARDLLVTGRRVDAVEAERIGLVSRCVAQARLHDASREAAGAALRSAPEARLHIKRMLNAHYPPIDEMTFAWSLSQPEVREGFRAFVERRTPGWVPEGLEMGGRL